MRRASRWKLAILATLLACGEGERPHPRPNILLIVADDMGYTDPGFFGSEIATPRLDELALGGLRFTNFHVGPSCSPTRAMLMTGMTNREVGISDPGAVEALASDVATLPERLRDAGYHTYMAGKWHLGHEAEHGPAARGFESSYAHVRAGDNHLGATTYPEEAVAYRDDGEAIEQPPDGWFSSELYADKLIDYIRANDGDGVPWFGYLAFTAPHWPLQLPDDWLDRYAGRYDDGYDVVREARVAGALARGILPEGLDLEVFESTAPRWRGLDEERRSREARAMELYAAMVENMDFHVGRVVDYLDRSGQLDATVIVFFSDNGADGADSSFRPVTIPRTDWDTSLGNMGREGSFVAEGRGWAEAATAPYRGLKGSFHEGGMLAAAFVTQASVAEPGGLDFDYLTVMDVLPTLLEIAGAEPPGSEIRGRSFWPRVKGSAVPTHDESEVIPWMTTDRRAALVRGRYKVKKDDADPSRWRLYDFVADPGERNDLSESRPKLRDELVAAWNAYADGLSDEPESASSEGGKNSPTSTVTSGQACGATRSPAR